MKLQYKGDLAVGLFRFSTGAELPVHKDEIYEISDDMVKMALESGVFKPVEMPQSLEVKVEVKKKKK